MSHRRGMIEIVRGRHLSTGFTLLELLISMVLLAVIVGVVAGALRIGYTTIEKGERRIERLERFKVSVALIKSQLESQVPLTRIEEASTKNYFEGEKESLKFTSNYSVWSGHKGFVLVHYRVETDQEGKKNLFVEENIVGVDKVRETVLLTGYDDIHFEYIGSPADPTTAEEEASDEWHHDKEVPSQVRVVLKRGKNNFTFTVSLRAKAVTVR